MTQPTGPGYYLAKRAALLQQHGKLIAVGADLMRDRYGEAFTAGRSE